MPKAKSKWKPVIVERDGESLTGYLLPPGTAGNSRYWAFTCLKAGVERKSLKTESFAEAKAKALAWFKHEPERVERQKQEQSILTWEDWDAIQVAHFRKKRDQRRAMKTLEECRKAHRLFLAVTGLETASAVDADQVDLFQAACPKTKSRLGRPYGNTTVRKTMAHMSASFNRCRVTAGKKCVRGVVAKEKLITVNPFEEVRWVEADDPEPRQFSREELKQFLAWKWVGGCPTVALFAKASLWSCGRITEMTELRWDWIDDEGYVTIPDDSAKWGKGKVIRLPAKLLSQIREHRNGSHLVWAGYVDELRAYHQTDGHRASAHKLKDFAPVRLRVCFQKWIKEWAGSVKAPGLSHHAFRRTGLQWSREGQLRSSEGQYAKALNVSREVADTHYTRKPQHLWADLTYRNIASELAEDRELADLMGLGELGEVRPVTPQDVQEALGRNDLREAARLLALLQG